MRSGSSGVDVCEWKKENIEMDNKLLRIIIQDNVVYGCLISTCPPLDAGTGAIIDNVCLFLLSLI